MNTQTIATTIAKTSSSDLAKARLMAVLVAGALLFVVGFAHAMPVHNFAHDTRHSEAFPCH